MAAPVNNIKSSCWDTPEVYKHHEQHKVCISRPKYREGRKDRAVKVYTINLESRYVMVQGVPAIGVMVELVALCALYGAVEEYRPLDEYPAEEFTEVYLVKFQKLTSARAAKRRMDGTSFYGGILHVCYVPEHETAEDARLKLQDRRRYVNRTAQMIAREKSELTEGDKEATASDNKTTPSQRTTTPSQRTTSAAAHDRGDDDNRARRSSSSGRYVDPSSDDNGARQGSSSGRFADRSSVRNNAGDSRTSSSHYAGGFPLLPLPPREEYRYRHNATTNPHRAVPTEDNMGTLHNAVVIAAEQKQQPTQSPGVGRSTPAIGDGGRGESRPTPEKAPAAAAVSLVPRFVPRTTHLENRKRKMEEAAKKSHLSSSCGVTGGDSEGPLVGPCGVTGGDSEGPLVGPKLPEPPRMDMEDTSLNTTVSRIRSTLQQVASVPDIKPVPKKMKPRRRI